MTFSPASARAARSAVLRHAAGISLGLPAAYCGLGLQPTERRWVAGRANLAPASWRCACTTAAGQPAGGLPLVRAAGAREVHLWW